MTEKDDQNELGCSETYDRECDVYYVTFNTGEPSYTVEVDDVILLEVGLYSRLPTGFRILNFSKSDSKPVKLQVAKKLVGEAFAKLSPPRAERKAVLEQALEKAFA
jgi:uncharacterized protein YuzE